MKKTSEMHWQDFYQRFSHTFVHERRTNKLHFGPLYFDKTNRMNDQKNMVVFCVTVIFLDISGYILILFDFDWIIPAVGHFSKGPC